MFSAEIGIAEKYNYLEEKFLVAYRWLAETNLTDLKEGAYPLQDQAVVAHVQEYTTIPANELAFETHEKYFDIQYVVSGKELFGICKRTGLTEKERKAETDLIFYEEPECAGSVLLEEGDFIAVAPEDAHKPRCIAGKPQAVKKIVIKVAVNE